MDDQDSVIAVYADYAAAQEGIVRLHEEGFSDLQISILGRDPASSEEVRDAAKYGDRTETMPSPFHGRYRDKFHYHCRRR